LSEQEALPRTGPVKPISIRPDLNQGSVVGPRPRQ
jgi:hypothetical protein